MSNVQHGVVPGIAWLMVALVGTGCGPRPVEVPSGGDDPDVAAAAEADDPGTPPEQPAEAGTAADAPATEEADAAATEAQAPAAPGCSAFPVEQCPPECRREPAGVSLRPSYAGDCTEDPAYREPGENTPYYEAGHHAAVVDATERCLGTWMRAVEQLLGAGTHEVSVAFRHRIAEGRGRTDDYALEQGELPEADRLFSCLRSGIDVNYAGGALVPDQRFPPPRTLRCTLHLQVVIGPEVCR